MDELRTWLLTSLPEADLDVEVYLDYIVDTLQEIPVGSAVEKEAAAEAVAELFDLLIDATEVDLSDFRQGLTERWSVVMEGKAEAHAKEVEETSIFEATAAATAVAAAAEEQAKQKAEEELALKEALVAQYSYVEHQGAVKKTAAEERATAVKPVGAGKFMKMWRSGD
jgi:hypothetical protein